jgi:CRP-like cAMP-binding protein
MGRILGGRNKKNRYKIIYTQNQQVSEQKVFRVVSGLVWLVQTNADGSGALVVDEVYPGEYFGQEALRRGVYQAEARQIIPGGLVEDFLWRNSTHTERFSVLNSLGSRLAESRWATRVIRGDVQARVLAYLTGLARSNLGKRVGDSIEVFLPRHEDLALIVGATRETVSTVIAKLRKSGLISCKNRRTLVMPAALIS